MRHSPRLEDQILAALRLALAEGHLDAAEHLLRAMEVLREEVPGTALADAYLALAGTLPERVNTPRPHGDIDA